MDEFSRKIAEIQSSVARLSEEYAELDDRSESQRATLSKLSASGGSTAIDGGQGGHNSVIVSLKEALQVLKRDIAHMNIHISMLSHTLLNQRTTQEIEIRKQASAKARARREVGSKGMKGRRHANKDAGAEDSEGWLE
jgi:hypothetical protein